MTELRDLMRANVADPPPEHLDVGGLVTAGRRRARARRARAAGAAASVATVAAVVTAAFAPRMNDVAGPADTPPSPPAQTLHVSDATLAVEGRDYRVLASHTNPNLDRDNGQYFDGVTDDGMILFRDGPHADNVNPRRALLDPQTGAMDWLPDLGVGEQDTVPVELSADRLVLVGMGGVGRTGPFVAYSFDRGTQQWHTMKWAGLPEVNGPGAVMGPDGRLYVSVPATQGQPPEGGWPLTRGGEADDSDAAGDTYDLWSVSLTDPSDVRNEHLSVGSVAFTPTSMVWTDRTNGNMGLIHIRDLWTGEEHSFDPGSGARCNLLSLSASQDRVVLDEFCGIYDGARDDRVQILNTNGEQVATIQGNGIGGAIFGLGGDDHVVTLFSHQPGAAGTYVYDLRTGRFLQISHSLSHFGIFGPTPDDDFLWTTPVNSRHGATQRLGQLSP